MRIWVPGEAKAQPRVKATIRGKHAGVYTPKTADAWKASVAVTWKSECREPPASGAVMVVLEFQMSRPKGHFGTGRNAGRLKESAPVYPAKKPDIDNLGKAVLDALKGLAWLDDSQVVDIRKIKRYTQSQPGCAITITPLPEHH